MTSKITKKGRNPGAVDNWLDTLGLYRKNVAYDETCLFRAVSEQLFDCQVYHERVRRDCIDYAKENYSEFSHIFDTEANWQEHLKLLEKHMVVCGNIEINIISKKYNRDVMVFDAARQQLFDITKRHLPKSLLLCLMDEDHYDVVYKRDHIVTAGFCQSIIYKILYEEVFNIQDVDEIVNGMLYDKSNVITQTEQLLDEKKLEVLNNNNNNSGCSDQNMSVEEVNEELENVKSSVVSTNIAPFPFKVAKALDPTIYRNIEYDSWGEVRREMRLGDWYYGDDKLILGTRCILNDQHRNDSYDCYIQEILKDSNKCVVYLTKLAERRTVNYTDLSPESDAKPWPLPYRFSKNLVIGSSPPLPADKLTKSAKKRNKDKRRTKSCSESSAIDNTAGSADGIDNVNAYVGIPLQMHNPTDCNYRNQETNTEVPEAAPSQEALITPEAPPPNNNRYQWEQPHWHFVPPTPDPFVWPATPTTPQNVFNFNLKPMVASAPVTPDVVPYHDPSFPFYYNYHVEPYNTSYNQWSSQTNDYHAMQNHEIVDGKSQEDKVQKIHTGETNYQYVHSGTEMYETVQMTDQRPTLCAAMPQNAQVEVYSPMIPIPPGTPVIYASDMTEVMMPTTPITMYTPSVEMQYVSPGPYVYPPTPPAAWYPTGINSQGFIFPPPMNTQTIPK